MHLNTVRLMVAKIWKSYLFWQSFPDMESCWYLQNQLWKKAHWVHEEIPLPSEVGRENKGKMNEKLFIMVSSQIKQGYSVQMKQSLSYLIHPRGSEEDPHFLCIFLQLFILFMSKLEMMLVFAIRFPPRVFGSVRSLQSSFVKLVLQFTFLEFGTIGTTILWR